MRTFNYLLALLLLASCSQESVLDNGEAVEIRLSGEIGNIGGGVTTRGSVDDNYLMGNSIGIKFARLDQYTDAAWPTYGAAVMLGANRTKGTGNQPIEFYSAQYYLTRESNNSTKLVGWYPNVALTTSAITGTVKFTLNGYTDVMLTNEVTANKKENQRFGDPGKIFTFKHLLTQVVVKYYGDAAAVDCWGAVNRILVKDCMPTCKVTLPNTVEFEGTPAGQLLRGIGSDGLMGGALLPVGAANAKTCGYLMFWPTTSNTWPTSNNTLTLEVTTEKGDTRDVTVALPAGSTFAAGTSYTVTLEFKSTAITPSATVANWTTATTNPGAGVFPN